MAIFLYLLISYPYPAPSVILVCVSSLTKEMTKSVLQVSCWQGLFVFCIGYFGGEVSHFIFKNYFEIIFNLQEICRSYTEFPDTLQPISPNVSILHGHSVHLCTSCVCLLVGTAQYHRVYSGLRAHSLVLSLFLQR